LIAIILGNSTIPTAGECNVLQDLYDGYLPTTYYTGWRDQIDNSAAFVLSEVSFGLTLLSACRTLNSNDSTNEQGW